MYTEIYGDVYFLINFTMDFIALFITSKVLKRRTRTIKMIFGAALGALFALFILIFPGNRLVSVLLTLLAGLLICLAAFGKHRIFLTYLIFIFSSLLLGGIMTLAFELMSFLLPAGRFTANSPSGGFFIAALACFGLSALFSSLSERCFSKSVCRIGFEISGIKIDEDALCDSGNLLREPISGLPVILLSKTLSERFIPSGNFSSEGIESSNLSHKKIRIIPCRCFAVSERMLISVLPEHCFIDGVDKRCVIAFCNTENFGGFNILVPGCLADKYYSFNNNSSNKSENKRR